MKKRLLCICPPGSGVLLPDGLALSGWDVCTVTNLDDAVRTLRGSGATAGLLAGGFDRFSHAELDAFLRAHVHLRWIGLVDSTRLADGATRSLLLELLHDYHTVPVDAQRLLHTLGHAHGWAVLRQQHRPAPAPASPSAASPILGSCDAVVRLRQQIARIGPVDAPVLIWGESGSGKELAAKEIHRASPRTKGPFIPVNCGAMPASLIQSELFGHARGAFTGASHDKAGLIEAASGGTLFLDEIGDLPLELQSNLLRFLQERTINRIGSTKVVHVDARVVAASHVRLPQAVQRGAFREDLFYRLNVLPLTVPPLRERRADLCEMAHHFLRAYAADHNARVRGFSPAAMDAMLSHDWPGNVRELINRIRRGLVMAEGDVISAYELGFEDASIILRPTELDTSRQQAERDAIVASLGRTGANISKAARDLGVSRSTMYRLIAKHAIRV